MNAKIDNNLFEQLSAQVESIPGIQVPPKVFEEMSGEAISYEENKSLTIKFPVKTRYQNPLGHMQGGMIVAAIDNTLGPLSYLVAPPSATTQLNTQYVRPILATDKFIEITAFLVEKTKNQLLMRAEVRNPKGKLVAVSQATQQII